MAMSRRAASSREILPGRLLWEPERPGGQGSRPALELCCYGAEKGGSRGRYGVQHYPPEACGRAFGPLGLDSLLRFCRGLEAALEAAAEGGGPVVLSTPPADQEYRANAAVLLGAYLLLRKEWPVSRVADCIGKADAAAMFACAWARTSKPEEPRQLSVQDCWLGVEVARQQGWIDAGFLRDDRSMEEQCRCYCAQLSRYDSAWLVPGEIMVGADPVTVQYDPNPATFEDLVPKGDGSQWEDKRVSQFSRASTVEPESTDPDSETQSNGSGASVGSVETVCKEYDASVVRPRGEEGEDSRDYASFLLDSGVKLIVRANYDAEPGMPKDSYADSTFEAYGIAQANIRINDTQGGLPKHSAVARALQHHDVLGEGEDAVLVHCKGGFGRSMVLACCLAIRRFDVPGTALLGWSRIVRPGALTCVQQERFLKSLRGSQDVLRFAKMPLGVVESDDKVKVSCGVPCHIQ